jgi:hypothetical protein
LRRFELLSQVSELTFKLSADVADLLCFGVKITLCLFELHLQGFQLAREVSLTLLKSVDLLLALLIALTELCFTQIYLGLPL